MPRARPAKGSQQEQVAAVRSNPLRARKGHTCPRDDERLGDAIDFEVAESGKKRRQNLVEIAPRAFVSLPTS